MEDLIYKFLLQSDYPRSSVILDMDVLGPNAKPADNGHVPAFVIVDPETAELLAVIDVVDAVDGDGLRQVAQEAGAFAARLDGRLIQAFVIRVDVRGRTEAEQVQFYRVWPNNSLQQLTSKSFPDLETLRVARKLAQGKKQPVPDTVLLSQVVEMDDEEEPVQTGYGMGMYIPALLLLALIFAEAYFMYSRGTPLLTLPQSVLAFGAAMLFSLPSAIRYLRR